MRRIRPKLTYANVMATIAVFAVLGGGAYAASKIGPKDIKKNAVRSKHIKNKQVKGADINPRARAMWALVSADAEIESQSGGISVQQADGNGFTRLKFPRPVQGRAIVATITTCNVLGTPCGEPGIKALACGGGVEGNCEDFDNTHVAVAPYIEGDQVNAAFYVAALP